VPRACRLVALLTDYGWEDPYAGIVKGVVEKAGGGEVRVVDITHGVKPFSVLAGAYVLYASYKYFPEGTVFLAVVDPGVGTGRRSVAIKTTRYFFVGPDNGLLHPAASEDGIEEVRILTNRALMLERVSRSFHGRDIFAPVAAFLARGGDFAEVGELVDASSLVELRLKEPCRPLATEVEARVVYVDSFGNAALGLELECLDELCKERGKVLVEAPAGEFAASCSPVFSLAKPGDLVFYENSAGFPELAVNLGSAAKLLKVDVGDVVVVKKAPA